MVSALPLFASFVWAGLVSAATIPRSDDGVVLFKENDGWDSAYEQMARGGGGGAAMMWSGWGPSGMTAFTSSGGGAGSLAGGIGAGGDLVPPQAQEAPNGAGPAPAPAAPAPDQERGPRSGVVPPQDAPNGNGNGNGRNGNGLAGTNGQDHAPADRSYGNGNGHGNGNGNGHHQPGNGGSNANASFNAWFPIVLGLFPGSQGGLGGLGGQGEGQAGAGGQGGFGGGYPPVAAVANSISHGSHGVASSHAVAYGAQPQYNHRPHQGQSQGPPANRYYGGPEPQTSNGNGNHAPQK